MADPTKKDAHGGRRVTERHAASVRVLCRCGRIYPQPSPTMRCLCGEVVAVQNETTESYRRAVEILADEAEAYLSAVGDEDDAAPRIRWAIRRVKDADDA